MRRYRRWTLEQKRHAVERAAETGAGDKVVKADFLQGVLRESRLDVSPVAAVARPHLRRDPSDAPQTGDHSSLCRDFADFGQNSRIFLWEIKTARYFPCFSYE